MATDMSYILPRDPSILAPGIRPLPASRKNLFTFVSEDHDMDEKNPVKVYLRIKPTQASEKCDGFLKPGVPESAVFEVVDNKVLIMKQLRNTSRGNQQYTNRYTFTEIFNSTVDQKKLFQKCIQDSVRDFVTGTNALLLAYGTTNAGKTHTMIGDLHRPGIVPRSIHMLFNCIKAQVSNSCRLMPVKVTGVTELDDADQAKEARIKHDILQWNSQYAESTHISKSMFSQTSDEDSRRLGLSICSNDSMSVDFISYSFREMQERLHDDTIVSVPASADTSYTVWVSFSEIYNENIYDLLVPPPSKGASRKNLNFATDSEHNVYIKDLRHVCVRSGDEAYQVMLFGRHNLRSAPTSLNHTSSRSHCIFTIKLVHSDNTTARVSTFSFCDLAGSERVKKTNNVGDRFKESLNINTSLHVLGRCLTNIRDNQKLMEKKLVPYRDSKLTRLFQRSLSGNDRVSMLVNVSTQPDLISETQNVLSFSAIALQIVHAPIVRPRPKKNVTRFSIIASKYTKRQTIAWDIAEEESDAASDVSTDNTSAVSRLVAQLRSDLLAEQLRNQTLEEKIRGELADKVVVMLKERDDRYRKRIEESEARNEELQDWRLQKLQEHYEQERAAYKRKRTDDDDDNNDVDDKMDPVLVASRLQSLQSEVDTLQQELDAVKHLNVDALKVNDALRLENSRLTFELTNSRTQVATLNNTLETMKMGGDDKWKQLNNEAQAEVASQQTKIDNLKSLLDEAKQEYDTITEHNTVLETDLHELESLLATKEMELEKRTAQDCVRGNEVRDLEQELKDTVKALSRAEAELRREQDARKHAEMQWKCDEKQWESIMENLQLEMAKLQEENTALRIDMSSFEERRDKQFVLYDDLLKKERDALKKEKEDKERQKQEVKCLQEVLYNHTPTPKKNEQVLILQEELRSKEEQRLKEEERLKKEVVLKDLEISKLNEQMKAMSVSRSKASKQNSKENTVPVETPASTRRQTRRKDVIISPAPVTVEPKSEKKQVKKKLFLQSDDVLLVMPEEHIEDEVKYTATPADVIKRSLRTRRN